MLNLPHDLYTAQQTRDLDRLVTQQYGLSTAQLMARAGAAALKAIKQHWPEHTQLIILCGTGNNGGDGFELATQALADGFQIQIFQVGTGSMSDETHAARSALLATGTQVETFAGTLPDNGIIIDCLFGTGLNREVEGDYKRAIDAINHSPLHTLSVDIPSGLQADTGAVMGAAINATVSISLISLNIGLFNGQGPNVSGSVCFDSLAIPHEAYLHFSPVARRLDLANDGALLAPRERTGHKGSYGHLLVIGGDHGMSGAIRLASEAGARVGAGLISIATRKAHSTLLTQARPCLMSHGVDSLNELAPLISRANSITLGPGLGQNDWGKALFNDVITRDLAMVVDADALNLLSQQPQRSNNWILTPHPGEAARLLDCTTAEVQAERFKAVRALQSKYGGVAVLKGAGTLICDGSDVIRLSTFGNPGMGSGGMGDVLAGVIGGLLAQGFPLMDAACVGVRLHSMAGDKAAEQDGERGMLAMDLMPHLRHLANLIY